MHSLSAPASRVSPLRGGQGVSASSTTPPATPTLPQAMTAPSDRITPSARGPPPGAKAAAPDRAMRDGWGMGGEPYSWRTYDGYLWQVRPGELEKIGVTNIGVEKILNRHTREISQ